MATSATTNERSDLSIAITGAGRGLGLEFTRQYLGAGHRLFALVRRPDRSVPLRELCDEFGDRAQVFPCDVSDGESMAAAAADLRRHLGSTGTLDLLINNAGITGSTGGSFGDLDHADMLQVLAVNALGPLRMSELCAPLMTGGRDPRIVHITSRMGSIADNSSGGWWAYRVSKAALNMVCKDMAFALRETGIATMVLHPGWVRTDMGGAGATLGVEESVGGMRSVIAELDLPTSGSFRDFSGEPLPW